MIGFGWVSESHPPAVIAMTTAEGWRTIACSQLISSQKPEDRKDKKSKPVREDSALLEALLRARRSLLSRRDSRPGHGEEERAEELSSERDIRRAHALVKHGDRARPDTVPEDESRAARHPKTQEEDRRAGSRENVYVLQRSRRPSYSRGCGRNDAIGHLPLRQKDHILEG